MEALKAELERKRKLVEEKKAMAAGKKFFKKSELEEQPKTAAIKLEQASPEKLNSNSNKLNLEDNENLGSKLSRKEVMKRLRERCHPILLFGELEIDAFKRLRKLEILEPEVDKGMRNDFQEALDEVDEARVNEILDKKKINDDESGNSSQNEGETNDQAIVDDEDDDSWEKINEDAAKHLDRGDKYWNMRIITRILKFLLIRWNKELSTRSQQEKATSKGKNASAMYKQTQVYLEPLFSKLSKGTIPEDILESLTDIIKHVLNRNYIKANDCYLQMAIGNAPWPIGVTMVGIHARTGREKIFSKNVAHVMNDETQRKYIQGLKRLITKCQQYYTTDPSRCVEFVPDRSKPAVSNIE